MKPDIESRVYDFNKKLTERLDDGNFQVNSDVDGKFDFTLPDLGINYDRGVIPTDEDYDDMIVEGKTNERD